MRLEIDSTVIRSFLKKCFRYGRRTPQLYTISKVYLELDQTHVYFLKLFVRPARRETS